ncbi:FTR1 family protein [Candidatus Uhrbacteria bacterium]|nr:FTR1 family protein [Candidatus Uhrbacteria bacterium]
MFASFLITFREVIEASLIVATILGILLREGKRNEVRTVWHAVTAAIAASIALIILGGIVGVRLQEVYTGETEEVIEGVFMLVTAFFITGAVVFLHNFFARGHKKIMDRIASAAERNESRWLFGLAFFSVLREGIEIVLFLSGLLFSTSESRIAWGAMLGALTALCVAYLFFIGVRRLPALWAVQGTNFFLVLFAGWLVSRGLHEVIAFRFIPTIIAIIYTAIMVYIIFYPKNNAQSS